ncbi:hypothetical protein CP49_05115 [Bradyrhizobium valentinum]|uniref:Uncharacterized protein n=1 Tax=Bradyrhizobium valentinum TaxID=1518501 RepID=A0A0R3L9K1_9BRAD|nr:hypothetical protein CP49_05115 [Bradyrhizobium valentinum]
MRDHLPTLHFFEWRAQWIAVAALNLKARFLVALALAPAMIPQGLGGTLDIGAKDQSDRIRIYDPT